MSHRKAGRIDRRQFLGKTTGALLAASLPRVRFFPRDASTRRRPNILWISTEDINPDLGCYGDQYAVTPTIDRLAAEGIRYTHAFTHSGVCAPTRHGIITGMYPTTTGAHHMRCQCVPQPWVRCFTEYLRAAGYYCTNNVKTDYQFRPPRTAWDESSRSAHWRNRPKGMPFFAVFNFTTTHESKVRDHSERFQARLATLGPHERHDPNRAKLPPYYPDTPVVRRDWAQYYDTITLMDKQVAEILRQLEEDGLAEDTIVFFWGDNGRGLPRAKRWVYDSGIWLPLIVRVPEKYRRWARPDNPDAARPGSVCDDMVAFIDLGPTVLSLAGVEVPEHMQGQPFLGPQRAKPRQYIFAARDRMDERYDVIRAVRDKRFKYIRNFMPHLPYSQYIWYCEQTPTTREWRRLHEEGKLTGPPTLFFQPRKPVEELYDTQSDPFEIRNLAGLPEYRDVLERFRRILRDWMSETGDLGLIPEAEFDAIKRPGGKWQKTAAPTIQVERIGEGRFRVAASCSTEGSRIAFTLDEEDPTRWQLYTTPVELKTGQVIRFRANRIGYEESEEVRYRAGGAVPQSQEKKGERGRPGWWEMIPKSGVLQRLLTVKELDFLGPQAVPRLVELTQDPEASVRYWAMVGLHANCPEEDRDRARSVARRLLSDSSPSVRIAAAQALCDWGETDAGLPVLVELLQHPQDSVRVMAGNALDQLGAKARPALTAMKRALEKDRNKYVQRLMRHAISQLDETR